LSLTIYPANRVHNNLDHYMIKVIFRRSNQTSPRVGIFPAMRGLWLLYPASGARPPASGLRPRRCISFARGPPTSLLSSKNAKSYLPDEQKHHGHPSVFRAQLAGLIVGTLHSTSKAHLASVRACVGFVARLLIQTC
jgi:hypothetical protein